MEMGGWTEELRCKSSLPPFSTFADSSFRDGTEA